MTTFDVRLRRSALYLPASNARALEKAKTLPADVLIFDLEDAVAPDAKAEARAQACASAASGAYGTREIIIRVNGLGTEWHDADVAAAARSGAHGILVPKVNSANDVHLLATELDQADAPAHMTLWAMIESPRAILHAEEIATSSDRLTVLVMGTNDLVNETHSLHLHGRSPIHTALSMALLAAKSAGKAILDGVYNDVQDGEGFAAEARQGRELGFDGKTVIHPSQLEPANQAFKPSESEVEYARAVIDAFEEAHRSNKGVITLNGRMIESLHVRDAQRILALHGTISGAQPKTDTLIPDLT